MYGPSVLRWLAVAMVALVPMAVVGNVALPQNDPFYYPPKGWQNKQPGDILRSRKIQARSTCTLGRSFTARTPTLRTSPRTP